MNLEQWLGENNKLGQDIWHKKYQYENESFDEWLDRVSGGNESIKRLIIEKKFLFGGRILANRNIPGNKTYSNCYVIEPPEDNLESIFDAAKKLARTFSYGGGCGIDIGKLCPKDARVNNAAKKSSGVVSFMDLYNMTTGLIGQNGRRGALMLSMPVNHPDVEEFISIKSDLTKITNANISVRVDDAFMKAVQNNEPYKLEFFRAESGEVISKVVNAKEVFHKLCEMNWNYAEPGILFWDAITEHNLLQYDDNFEYAGVNPCAEEPLPAGGSCLLGAINLAAFVEHPFTQDSKFDFVAFKHAVADAVYALNEVLDEGLPLHPLEEQRNSVRDWRQIGLGIMGLADCLIKLGLIYGSSEANHMCEVIARALFGTSVHTSESIAKDYGSYPMCDIDAINASDMMKSCELEIGGIHNSQLLTVAPTGSISTMIGVSGGIEPIFANSYTRKTQSLHGEDVYYKVYTPIVEHYMKAHDIKEESDLPPEFVVASDIDPMSRIECQAAWQKWIDASISSTINLPNESTIEDVENIYMHAWECGLKGVTVYRAGCAREGVLVTEETKEKTNDNVDACNCVSDLPRGYIVDTSDDLIGYKRKLTTGCGTMHMEVYFDELSGEPQETFINIGSGGGCERNYQFISRLISLALRGGVPIEDIIDQANSIRPCNAYVSRTKSKHDTSKGTSCPSAVGNTLKDLYSKISDRCFDCDILEETTTHKKNNRITINNKSICPDCGSQLQQEGGCNICKNCGWTKCD